MEIRYINKLEMVFSFRSKSVLNTTYLILNFEMFISLWYTFYGCKQTFK